MKVNDSIALHKELRGKISVSNKYEIKDLSDLSVLYTPGVAKPCVEISLDKSKAYDYTIKGNTIAIVTDGTRVLGLGNIGPEAALPVMEGKAMIFKRFGDINAFPICLQRNDPREVIDIVKGIAPSFGGINLEDIESPDCFFIEESLQNIGIPVFHDDQHGTAIAIVAALKNSLKLVGKDKGAKVIIAGAGAAGIATVNLMYSYGFKNIIIVDSKGIIHQERTDLNKYKMNAASLTSGFGGTLDDAIRGSDVVIALSGKPGLITESMVKSMNRDPIVFALTNPEPEIDPASAKIWGARIVATGRSDFPNQINNSLVFPGIFRGALDSRSEKINLEMKIAAVDALADFLENPTYEKIIPLTTEEGVHAAVSDAVHAAAVKSGVAAVL